jgi:hypothetical protein
MIKLRKLHCFVHAFALSCGTGRAFKVDLHDLQSASLCFIGLGAVVPMLILEGRFRWLLALLHLFVRIEMFPQIPI